MELQKTTFSIKISILITSTLLAFISPVSAEEVSDTSKQEKISCKTTLACQKLSESLQAKIDVLEAEGIENLTDNEFEHYAKLSDDLSAAKRSEIQHNEKLIATLREKQGVQLETLAALNKKQSEQEKIIVAENKKQEKMRLTQDQEIAKLRGMLLKQ